jgi:hypothetical protein
VEFYAPPTAQKSNGDCGAPAVRPQGARRRKAPDSPRCIQTWAGGPKAAGGRKEEGAMKLVGRLMGCSPTSRRRVAMAHLDFREA